MKKILRGRDIKWRSKIGKDPKESLYREVGGNCPPFWQVGVITVVLAVNTGSRLTC